MFSSFVYVIIRINLALSQIKLIHGRSKIYRRVFSISGVWGGGGMPKINEILGKNAKNPIKYQENFKDRKEPIDTSG